MIQYILDFRSHHTRIYLYKTIMRSSRIMRLRALGPYPLPSNKYCRRGPNTSFFFLDRPICSTAPDPKNKMDFSAIDTRTMHRFFKPLPENDP